jgi:hypothetical protein
MVRSALWNCIAWYSPAETKEENENISVGISGYHTDTETEYTWIQVYGVTPTLDYSIFYGTTAHTWALSSSLLRFLNHIQLDAR